MPTKKAVAPGSRIAASAPAKKSGLAKAVQKMPADSPSLPESRQARRKRETRERLLDAAFRLMAERGVDAVAINEITEAADVGFGSFYNHFESRDEIYTVLMDTLFENFGDALERLVKPIEDPAEVISACIRHTLLRARREPLWGRFLIRECLSPRLLTHGLGVRLMRDIQTLIASGQYKVPDPVMNFIAIVGGVLAAISAELQIENHEGTTLHEYGLDRQGFPERAAAVLLHGLGMSFKKADAIARRPLPVFDSSIQK